MAFEQGPLFEVSGVAALLNFEQRAAAMELDWLAMREQRLRRFGEFSVAVLREEAPKRTGWFASRIHCDVSISGMDMRLGFTWPQPLGTWITGGTGLFGPRKAVIRPVRAKVLRFWIGGKKIFAAWVRGMRPNPFVDRAMARIRPRLMTELRGIGNAVITGLAGK